MVFFSTIIPVFNREHLIKATLNSALAQEFNDQEIIVIDDGSTDKTFEVLSEYSDRIKVLRQENKGAGAARNLGIFNAQGKYIAFLDSDDLWFPWTLSIYKQAIQENNCPAFIAGRAISFKDKDEIQTVCKTFFSLKYFNSYYDSGAQCIGSIPSSVTVRADVFQEVEGFTERRGRTAEDADFWLRIGTHKGFASIQSPQVSAQRLHSGNHMGSGVKTYPGACYLVEQEKKGEYPGGVLRQRERLVILTCYIRPISLACLHQGELKKAWRLYSETFSWHVRLRRIRYLVGFIFLSTTTFLFQVLAFNCRDK